MPPLRRLPALLALLLLARTAAAQVQMYPGDYGTPPTPVPQRGGTVTAWTLAADRLGNGGPNWRTRAVMHIAMHDALNAASPRYARWRPAARGEPPAAGADPLVAMAAAAYQVLVLRHPDTAAPEADRLYRAALGAQPPGPASDRAVRLGTAIGRAIVAAYPSPAGLPGTFPVSMRPGEWRPTPPDGLLGSTGREQPFLARAPAEIGWRPPHPLGSPAYVAGVEEVRALGGESSTRRTPAQTEAAVFWAFQSSQRGYMLLAVDLLAARPLPGGAWDEARAMLQLTVALGDSASLAWAEKLHYRYWRPVTAINLGGHGVQADRAWTPLIDTPPHPDHPSGHATDCWTAALVLRGVFGRDIGPVEYPDTGRPTLTFRRFDRVTDAAAECAMSRLWAGVHFRLANEEGARLAGEIARRALAAAPPLRARAPTEK